MSNRTVCDLALQYLADGFSPIPILRGHKVPGYAGSFLTDWAKYCETPADESTISRWYSLDHRAGLGLCGGYNNFIAVDIDDKRAYAAAREVLRHLVMPMKRGLKGGTGFAIDPTGSIQSHKIIGIGPNGERGSTLVEFLAHGNQSVVPPSWHPGDKKRGIPSPGNYRWLRGTLEGLHVNDLPVITLDMVARLEELLEPLRYRPRVIEAPTVEVKGVEDLGDLERRRYFAKAAKLLENKTDELMSMSDGRHNGLFAAACACGVYVKRGFLKEADVFEALLRACKHNGYLEHRSEHIARQGIGNGLALGANDPLRELRER